MKTKATHRVNQIEASKNHLRYLDYSIYPCPTGWAYEWDSYDGAEDGNRNAGTCATIDECIEAINEKEFED